jgi:hypothetical protein
MNRTWAAVLATALAAGIGNARAEVVGSVQIDWSTFAVQIIDLDLGDGIVPTLSFDAPTQTSLARVVPPAGAPLEQTAGDWSSPLSVSLALPGGTLTASVAASGQDLLLAQSDGLVLNGPAEVLAQRSAAFTSTGKSIVLFSVDYSVTVSGLSPGESFSALAGLGWESVDALGAVSSAKQEFGLIDANGTAPGSTLQVAFVNLSGNATVGTVYGAASVTSVPEPQTILMLAAGAGLLALRLRRTRRRPI